MLKITRKQKKNYKKRKENGFQIKKVKRKNVLFKDSYYIP